MLAAAGASRCRLTALPMPAPEECSDIVLRSTTSVLFAATADVPVARLLVVLRGRGADMRALAWSAVIAVAELAELTLLVLSEADRYDLHDLLSDETEGGRHLADSISVVTSKGIEPTMRIRQYDANRQYDASRQIVEELATQRYDMLVLCAERHGEFVAETVRRLLSANTSLRALLVCKPNRIAAPYRPCRKLQKEDTS